MHKFWFGKKIVNHCATVQLTNVSASWWRHKYTTHTICTNFVLERHYSYLMEPPFDDVTSMPLNVKRRARLRVIFLLNGITDRRRLRLVSVRSFQVTPKSKKFHFNKSNVFQIFDPRWRKNSATKSYKKKLNFDCPVSRMCKIETSQKNHFLIIPNTIIASTRQGNWLTRPAALPLIESTLYWVPDLQVELYCTGLLPMSSTTLCYLYLLSPFLIWFAYNFL